MILANDFFHIDHLETVGESYRCKVHLNAQHSIFQVHFPGYPITPGVCLIQMGTEMLEQILGKSLRLRVAREIKFKRALTPADTPTFVFTKVRPEDSGLLRANISIEDDGGTPYATMSLRYQEG